MPVQLLPASAAAFAPRSASVNVVLGSKVDSWLTLTLKRINRVKRPLNSVSQHQRCLAETLANKNAIWTLASIMLPKLPEADMPTDYSENLFSHQLVHIEAYIVHVDMVLRNEVAYKLTTDTIDALVEYHKEVHCVDVKANSSDWSGKEQQCKKLHEDFVQAINKFVYHTHVTALEGLEEDGAGELLCGKSEEVRNNLMNLMKNLVPPPPRVVEIVRQPTLLPSSPMNNLWGQAVSMPPPVDAWNVLPSSPSVASTVEATTPVWHNMHMQQQRSSDDCSDLCCAAAKHLRIEYATTFTNATQHDRIWKLTNDTSIQRTCWGRLDWLSPPLNILAVTEAMNRNHAGMTGSSPRTRHRMPTGSRTLTIRMDEFVQCGSKMPHSPGPDLTRSGACVARTFAIHTELRCWSFIITKAGGSSVVVDHALIKSDPREQAGILG
ncbi:hypothetical protein CCM_02666 [Cordyceps militaris CM01]|uniref:Uncharacterized protein n=1 Tax=Cordyceps militaris (strain CM01) TaxID=983644 RepID=G3JB35_CORMM|nr:uncharacterized protein CCM_02666 [Cordyceps militaris CM01]EGX94395.1 hypothetical protein CCM_02666 [Cordyceps militaris CM01]